MIFRITIVVLFLVAATARAEEPRILKVLSHLVDSKGRHALSPSLYARDAYQVHLRENRDLVSGLRFDIQYKAKRSEGPVLVRLEVRASKGGIGNVRTFEVESTPARFFGSWARIDLDKSAAEALGTVIAWRATLLRKGEIVAKEQSFLW